MRQDTFKSDMGLRIGVEECWSDASRQVCKLGAKEKMNVEHSTPNIELRMTPYP